MRNLGLLLVSVGIFWFVFELTAPGTLPDFGMNTLVLSGLGLAVGIVVLWLDERARQRRKWKSVRRR